MRDRALAAFLLTGQRLEIENEDDDDNENENDFLGEGGSNREMSARIALGYLGLIYDKVVLALSIRPEQ